MDEIAELRAELAALRARVQAAEDYRELVNLQGAYGYYVDKGLWDRAADLFAADGTLEIAGRGVYVGRERVRAYLRHLPPYGHGTLYNHMIKFSTRQNRVLPSRQSCIESAET